MTADISEADRDAFERAIAIMLRHREAIHRRDFRRRLAEAQEPWESIGRHAASVAQSEALRVRPWETAPCDLDGEIDDPPGYEHRRTAAAAAILTRLLAANLSRFEPDPVNALAQAERGGHKR
jgi:hypothetical protein